MRRGLTQLAIVLLWIPSPTAVGPSRPEAFGDITYFHTDGADEIVPGPDGRLWFTAGTTFIGSINTSGGQQRLEVPHAADHIAAGPDGNLWFTESGHNQIGRITSRGIVTEFSVPTQESGPEGIAAGPDGNVWFVENSANAIARITPSGTIAEFPLPPAGTGPRQIAAGADGNLWFTAGSSIGRITTSGVITEFAVPGSFDPQGIGSGPDGNVWYTAGNDVGKVTPSGVVTEFTVASSGTSVSNIATGSDGNLWITETGVDVGIGQIDPSGSPVAFFSTTLDPNDLGIGPDGNIWFTEEGSNPPGSQIGRLDTRTTDTAYGLVMDGAVSPRRFTAPLGGSFEWIFLGPGSHTVTDVDSGQFDSGPHSFVTYYSFTPFGAGGWNYVDSLHPTMKGWVTVSPQVVPASGTVNTTFTITWALDPPPPGVHFSVDVQRPGTGFHGWLEDVTSLSADFVPDAGPGDYAFHVCTYADGVESRWGAARIKVTG